MTKLVRTPYSCPECGSNATRYRVTRKAHICNHCGCEFVLGEPTEIADDSLFGETKTTRLPKTVRGKEIDDAINKAAKTKVIYSKDDAERLGFAEGQGEQEKEGQ